MAVGSDAPAPRELERARRPRSPDCSLPASAGTRLTTVDRAPHSPNDCDVSTSSPGGRTDRASLETNATPEQLYDAFTEGAKLMQWLPPGTMTGQALDYDFRERGRYRIALTYDESAAGDAGKSEGRTDVSTGRFLALEPGRRIVQSVEFESTRSQFSGEMVMTWNFEPIADGTRVTITAENVPAGIGEADHAAGLRSSLENLAKFVAG